MPRFKFDRSTAAIHDVGHIVCALSLGVPVGDTRIANEGTAFANVVANGGLAGGYAEIKYGGDIRDTAILLAGSIAQKLSGDTAGNNAGGDYAMIAPGTTAKEIGQAAQMATKALSENWPAVEALSAELLVKGVVSGEESKAIYDRHKKTNEQCLVDAVAAGLQAAIAALPAPPRRRPLNFKGIEPTYDCARDPFS